MRALTWEPQPPPFSQNSISSTKKTPGSTISYITTTSQLSSNYWKYSDVDWIRQAKNTELTAAFIIPSRYFTHSPLIVLNSCCKRKTRVYLCLDMGAPTSSIFSEFYLQHQQYSRIYDLLRNHNITGYFRHVDDILIIYDESTTNTKGLLHCFNNPNPKLKFTLQKEVERRINFLDLTIHREHNKFSIDIYRKPNFTDTITPNDSCHPEVHKLAVVRSLYDRLDNYHLPLT